MPGPPIHQRLRATWADLLDLALPTSCPACGAYVESGRAMLCERCAAALDEARRAPACARCASPLPDPLGPCGRCRGKGVRPFTAIARLGTFESTLRSLIHAVKYGRRWPLVPLLVGEMVALPTVAGVLDHADVLVPVPLHWTRRLGRGFNQSQLIAQALRRHHRHLTVVQAVRRVRRTPSQLRQRSRAARRRNMARAFRVTQPDLLAGRHVVLVDDVMTTGATLLAVARAIRQSTRCASIAAVVLASANPLHTDLTAT